ncbi:STAS domain-containing protein [Ferrimonas aestuarii]|uniref:STAS domain-containing protein n=1 Tax=Ferrimonas aestuarii TaxID=2569539 RepID=A0A4U1BRI7_9GAMM|nr:STAS domain-containing protein [Ferrimonas aestuarii]TKB57464.1 STAS domain-containing protein [Ferrimonas aestuarii]
MEDMDASCAEYSFGATLTVAQVSQVKQALSEILARAPSSIYLQSDKIERIDAAGLQLLLSFANQCHQEQRSLQIEPISDCLAQSCRYCGIALSQLSNQP